MIHTDRQRQTDRTRQTETGSQKQTDIDRDTERDTQIEIEAKVFLVWETYRNRSRGANEQINCRIEEGK